MGSRGAAAVGVALVIGVAGASATIATPACTTHKCDYSEADAGDYFNPIFTGDFVGDTWESSPIDADWIDFKPERRFTFWMPIAFRLTRRPISMLAYLSEEQHPVPGDYDASTPPQIIGLAAGNAAEMTYDVAHGVLTVHNGTCQEYFVRIVVTFEPMPDGGSDEAGLDAAPDAVQDGASDAGAEASADANAD